MSRRGLYSVYLKVYRRSAASMLRDLLVRACAERVELSDGRFAGMDAC